MKKVLHYINGKSDPGHGEREGFVFNPSTGEKLYPCAYADSATVDAAVSVAAEAGKAWKSMSHARRIEVIYKFRQIVLENTHELAVLIGVEHGKTIDDAKGEIARAVESIEFATNEPHLSKGEYSRNVGGGIDVFSTREALGVVGCIAPFNFPVMVPLMMATMAIACGNSVVLKPSEKVPSSAIKLGELLKDAGLPDGVWNVVNGDREAVDAMLEHPGIAAVSFVGSTPIGEYIYQKGSQYNKRVMSFTGGKNHMIVMPDADLEAAANAFVSAGYGSASQRCMAISLLIPVGEETASKLIELIVPKIKELKVGSYDTPHADFGAVISQQSKDMAEKALEDAIAAGAKILVDGRGVEVKGKKGGFYIGPSLLDGITTDMDFYKKEVFAPVRGVLRASSLDHAIEITNTHEYGNGAVIYTRDGYSASKFGELVEAGMIGINVPVPVPAGYHNFGGLRRSKFGDGHLFGPDAVRFYTKIKTFSQRWPGSAESSIYSINFPSNK